MITKLLHCILNNNIAVSKWNKTVSPLCDVCFVDEDIKNSLFECNIVKNIWQKNWNKRPMGHIAHLRKQFKSINTYDYIITLISRRKNPLSSFENWIVPCLNKLESPLPKGALCQIWLKLAQWFWKRFLNFVGVFFGTS